MTHYSDSFFQSQGIDPTTTDNVQEGRMSEQDRPDNQLRVLNLYHHIAKYTKDTEDQLVRLGDGYAPPLFHQGDDSPFKMELTHLQMRINTFTGKNYNPFPWQHGKTALYWNTVWSVGDRTIYIPGGTGIGVSTHGTLYNRSGKAARTGRSGFSLYSFVSPKNTVLSGEAFHPQADINHELFNYLFANVETYMNGVVYGLFPFLFVPFQPTSVLRSEDKKLLGINVAKGYARVWTQIKQYHMARLMSNKFFQFDELEYWPRFDLTRVLDHYVDEKEGGKKTGRKVMNLDGYMKATSVTPV